MTDQQKYLLLGGLGLAGLGYWYFFYGPGATATTTTTTTTTNTSPPISGPSGSSVALSNYPLAASWLSSTGPKFQSFINNWIATQPASVVQGYYSALQAIVPYWDAQQAPPASVTNTWAAYGTTYGFPSATT